MADLFGDDVFSYFFKGKLLILIKTSLVNAIHK